MEKIEFKSQICTTVEQSKRLLELGLKKDTADMCWQKTTLNGKVITYPAQDAWHCSTAITDYHIPAWSLHRLMEIMYKGDIHSFVDIGVRNRNIEWLFEVVIARIESLVKIKSFDIQYLEEKK